MRICVFCFAEVENPKSDVCPVCNAGSAFKPDLETKLFIAQRKLDQADTKIKRDKILAEMYEIIRRYSWGKLLNKKRRIPMLADEIEDYCHDAATKFIEHYLKDPNFRIDQSFGGYLGFKIWDVLHNKKKRKFEQQNVLTNEAESLGKMAFNERVRVDMSSEAVESIVRILRDASYSCFTHRGRFAVVQLLTAFLSLMKSPVQYRNYLKTIDADFQLVVDDFCWSVVRNELRKVAE